MSAQLVYTGTLTANDGAKAVVFRDEFGIPHIKAESEPAVFYAQGYCHAQDRLAQMLTFMLFAEGRLSSVYGSSQLTQDAANRRDLETPAERASGYAALPSSVKSAFESYSAGVNSYLDTLRADVAANKLTRIPIEIAQLQQIGLQLPQWTPLTTYGVAQFLMDRFGQFGGSELTNLSIVQSAGYDAFNTANPVNDTATFTTIPNEELGAVQPGKGNAVQSNGNVFKNVPLDKAILERRAQEQKAIKESSERFGVPTTFGSFAALAHGAKLQQGGTMLLGAPQMDDASKTTVAVVNEVELSCPSFHAGGMSIAGMPFVVIGRTRNFAWSLTSGISDNTDIFVDTIRSTGGNVEFYNNGAWKPMTVRRDTIIVRGANPVVQTVLVNEHGVSVDVDTQLGYAFMKKYTFRTGTFRDNTMFDAIYSVNSATSLNAFEAALKKFSMSFNVFYNDDKNVRFYHVGKYIDRRNDNSDPRLPRSGDGSQEWKGFLEWNDLPKLQSNPKQGYLVNWNNKPVKWWTNGDIGWKRGDGSTRDAMVLDTVLRVQPSVTFESMKATPQSAAARFPGNQPYNHYDRGTYQFVMEFTSGGTINNDNIFRPGQSGFISTSNVRSPHFSDLWDTFIAWKFKKQRFDEFATVGVDDEDDESDVTIYPNPSSGGVRLAFPALADTRVTITDALGRLVASVNALGDGSGVATAQWDGRDTSGNAVASGVYYIRTNSGAAGVLVIASR
ncbi:MAG: penicillin acylase family protein [Candidatus Kapabacteria bacterium]|nr:penicillin acylase family protein [Candidatus Kapabacteria bacterium]